MSHIGVLSSRITSLFSHRLSDPIKEFPSSGFFCRSVGALVVFRSSSADYGPLDHLPEGECVAETAPKQVQVIVDAEAEGGQHGRDLQQPAGGKASRGAT
ncbi:unnamed protein product [Musa banksii]